MKRKIFIFTFVLLLVSINAFAQCNLTGSSISGGLFFCNALTGSGTDDSPYLFANTGRKLFFGTNGVTTTPKMVIDTAGNVGIGTEAPGKKLQVTTSDQLDGIRLQRDVDGAVVGRIFFAPHGSQSNWNDITQNGDQAIIFSKGTIGTGSLVIAPWASETSGIRITNLGNVGIGTATPTVKLQVAGQVKITGGTPGAGKVLTSDADGLASWQAPAVAGGTVSMYRILNGCNNAGNITTNTTCSTIVCYQSEYPIYYNCSGECSGTFSTQVCSNTYMGKLVP